MPDYLGDRMKMYEAVADSHLAPRVPVIVRIDGKAFHTLTRGMDRPFDERLVKCMGETADYLVKEIQGCQFAYVQSDEISLLLTDWDSYETDCWFNYRVQKVVSVAAAEATAAFGRAYAREFADTPFINRLPRFDARAANYPRHEVVNYFVWRQQDWIRNSVHMLGRSVFSAKRLHRTPGWKVKEMLAAEGQPWEELPTWLQRGVALFRDREHGTVVNDGAPPMFKDEREYIEKHMPEVFWKEHEGEDE